MKCEVLDNGKPAKYPEINVHPSWNNNVFDDLDAALDYLVKWLGPYSQDKDYLRYNAVDQPFDYDGCGDMVEIKVTE